MKSISRFDRQIVADKSKKPNWVCTRCGNRSYTSFRSDCTIKENNGARCSGKIEKINV